jgi:hypothetical protein
MLPANSKIPPNAVVFCFFDPRAWDENPNGRQAFKTAKKNSMDAVFSLTVRATAAGEGRRMRQREQTQSPMHN